MDDTTVEQDVHLDETVLRSDRWDDRPAADDRTRIDARSPHDRAESRIGESHEITAETRAVKSSMPPSPPSAEPGSNPEPTVATKLDPGVAHLVPGTLVGEFVIDRLLGSGAMGQVYGAHHERLGKRVAVKVIAPSLSRDRGAIERFEQEAIALARLSHPNIVGVLNVGTLPGDDRAYFVMDWLDGQALQARIDDAPIPVNLALDVLDQIARALEAAHAAGIVHRDLKPDNVFLQRVGDEPMPVVRILDLGLAKLAEHRRSQETQVGVLFGTPQYMSPEQCQSARDVGPSTDVYALGALAYELLCGRLPFTYDNIAELIVAHQTEEPPPPRDLTPAIDPRLDELLLAMLAKDPAQRPTLAVVRSTIAAVRGAPPKRAPRTSSTVTAPRAAVLLTAPARRGLLIMIAGVTLLSFLVASLLMRNRGDSAEGQTASQLDADVPRADHPRLPEGSTTTAAERLVDAGVASHVPDARQRRGAEGSIPAVKEPDIGHEVTSDASVDVDTAAVDATPSEVEPRAQEPTSTIEPTKAERIPSTRVNQKPPRVLDRNTQPPRDPKDRTFDPFHGSSR